MSENKWLMFTGVPDTGIAQTLNGDGILVNSDFVMGRIIINGTYILNSLGKN